jgi:FkbM family methyltransferase
VKSFRWVTIALAVGVLTLAVGVRLNPPSLILFAPGVHTRSPFCNVWKASLDGHIKLRQLAVTRELDAASHVVRREAGLALWTTPHGDFWIPGDDADILTTLLAQEDRNIYGRGEWGVHPGDIVLDVGAYIGTWTRQALCDGAKLVVAIEPSPESIECLRRNLRAEIDAGKVIICPKGIWDYEGTLTLFANSGNGAGNSFVEENGITQKIGGIPVTTIDKLAAELHLPRVDFIKADVKGATERLLRGGEGVIRRDRPRIALSTEEVADHAQAIAQLAHRILPAYEIRCGPCLLDQRDIYTDVLFFR